MITPRKKRIGQRLRLQGK